MASSAPLSGALLLTVDLRSPFIVRHNTPHIEAWAFVLEDQFAPREESQAVIPARSHSLGAACTPSAILRQQRVAINNMPFEPPLPLFARIPPNSAFF
ncbi:MAG TPA: hypothetical protein DEP13_14645 [Gammaproteobacteria bacterium]|nr:hypothetical protein [Gammaproteobacteria bacterium]